MTNSCFGELIDSHDTVIRLGRPPLKGFESTVGSKTSVVYTRKGTCNENFTVHADVNNGLGAETTPDKFYLLSKDCNPHHHSHATFDGIHRYEHSHPALRNFASSLVNTYYHAAVKPIYNAVGPTSGFTQAMKLLASGLCTRVSAFGFGTGREDYYWGSKSGTEGILKSVHSGAIESRIFRVLMSHGFMCVYDFKWNDGGLAGKCTPR